MSFKLKSSLAAFVWFHVTWTPAPKVHILRDFSAGVSIDLCGWRNHKKRHQKVQLTNNYHIFWLANNIHKYVVYLVGLTGIFTLPTQCRNGKAVWAPPTTKWPLAADRLIFFGMFDDLWVVPNFIFVANLWGQRFLCVKLILWQCFGRHPHFSQRFWSARKTFFRATSSRIPPPPRRPGKTEPSLQYWGNLGTLWVDIQNL